MSDSFWSSVVFLSSFDGTNAATSTTDDSSLAHTITFNGNAQLDTSQKKFGASSLKFDGSGDFLSIAADSNLYSLPGQFTIEGFVRFSGGVSNQAFIGAWDNAGSSGSNNWFFYLTSGNLRFRIEHVASDSDCQATWTPSTGTWYHVCADKDASNVVRIYVDGVMLAKATIAVASNTNSKALTLGRIGTSTTFSSFDFNGNMDEWRFTNGVGRYVSDGGFTVPTAAYPRGDISPPAGSLALSGQAATISFRQNYAPAAKVLALQGYAPVLVAGSQGLSPGAGSLGITGYAGSMVFRLNKIPPKASLSLTGQVPSLSLSAPGGSGGSNSVITCAAIF